MTSPVGDPTPAVTVALPADALRSPSGGLAALVVRTAGGWRVLAPAGPLDRDGGAMPLVEALSLADLVAAEQGSDPEPDRQARRAARTAEADGAAGTADTDPRDAELAGLRRTVAQLEHALAARVSIERAIGVLAERQSTTPRDAFEQLRRRARSTGRPAAELAREVLDGLARPAARETPEQAGHAPVPPVPAPPGAVPPVPGPRVAGAPDPGPPRRRSS